MAHNVFSLAVRWGNRSTKLSNHHQTLIEKLHLGLTLSPPLAANECWQQLFIMSRENITKAFHFGAKVKFNRSIVVHPDLKDKEYCLIGFCDNAYALIEWEKRGQYHFEYYTGSVYADLELSV